MNKRFENQSILITGAGSGMGEATALRLAAEGARVTLWGRREALLQQVAAQIHEAGGSALVQCCDVGDPVAIRNNLAELVAAQGSLTGVFANAGILGDGGALDQVEPTDFEALIRTNLVGTQQTVAQALRHMKRGAVVINASWTASAVMPTTGAYAASKAALLAMMRVWAVEDGPRDIRINAVSPGIILTPMAAEILDQQTAEQLAQHTPLRRNGRSEDLAGTVAWLLSEDAAFVTGQDITVDGGFTLGGLFR